MLKDSTNRMGALIRINRSSGIVAIRTTPKRREVASPKGIKQKSHENVAFLFLYGAC